MKTRTLSSLAALFTAALVILAMPVLPACAEDAAAELGPDEYYTAYNIWYENPQAIPSINYKRGTVLPIGSVVSDVRATGRGVSFFVKEYGMQFSIDFTAKFHPGLTPESYKERMITKTPLAERVEGFTDVEKSGIETANIYDGMSKEAVLMAWGYPPEHRTPSIKLPNWVYWSSRFVQKTLAFDSDGKLADFRKW